MKKSNFVTLVLSGALVSGCDNRKGDTGYAAGTTVTNNTYVSGRGYYHAPCHGWFEYPYNYYRPGFGYYHGGVYTPRPFVSDIVASSPSVRSTSGGIGREGGAGRSSSGVTRGGFGSFFHGGFHGS